MAEAPVPLRPVRAVVDLVCRTRSAAQLRVDHCVADRIQARRRALGLTITDLAKRSGVSEGSLALYESAEMRPVATDLIAILSALGTLPSKFFADIEQVLHS